MEFPNVQLPQINLARRQFEPPFYVDMEAFFEFSFWISEELLDLEADYALKKNRRDGMTSITPRVTIAQ